MNNEQPEATQTPYFQALQEEVRLGRERAIEQLARDLFQKAIHFHLVEGEFRSVVMDPACAFTAAETFITARDEWRKQRE